MKNTHNRVKRLSAAGLVTVMCGSAIFSGCSESFLKPDPLSFYEPETTFTTESGLQAALAMADRHIRSYWTYYEGVSNSVPIGTEYMFSDLAIYGKSDVGVSNVNFDIANGLTPTGGAASSGNDGNYIGYFWGETYTGIKYANTVISYIDGVTGLSEATKNAYLGRAYFHRSFRYLNLVFQYGDVPLVTKIIEVPKQNYRSTRKEAILEMITENMEFAVEWVPDQKDNKGERLSNNKLFSFTMDKRNVYWPIPNSAIEDNLKGTLAQNYGYDGYDASVPVWETWQEAVADEDNTGN